jgi:hypothetical protein
MNKCEALLIMSRSFGWDVDLLNIQDGFNDTPEWCKPYAGFARSIGVVTGESETILGTERALTRNEYAAMIARYLNGSKLDQFSDLEFTDTAEIPDWAMPHVQFMKDFNFINGYEDGRFAGFDAVTKIDFGVTMLRVAISQ